LKLSIRLYYKHDLDLIVLYYNKNFKFKKQLKQTLLNFAEGIKEIIPLPEYQSLDNTDIPCRDVQLHIVIEEQYVIEKLNKINKFQRNSFIKNLFRNRLSDLCFMAYLEDYKVEERVEEKEKEEKWEEKEKNIPKQEKEQIKEEAEDDYKVDDDDIFGMFEGLM